MNHRPVGAGWGISVSLGSSVNALTAAARRAKSAKNRGNCLLFAGTIRRRTDGSGDGRLPMAAAMTHANA
jgi:hypothetical protein